MRGRLVPHSGQLPLEPGGRRRGTPAFGHWPIRIAEAGTCRIEVRRWPREADAPHSGIPIGGKTVDACLPNGSVSDLLYGGAPTALPVTRVQLRIGGKIQEAAVEASATAASFLAPLEAGPVDLEATLLDRQGKPLGGAPYVTIRRLTSPIDRS